MKPAGTFGKRGPSPIDLAEYPLSRFRPTPRAVIGIVAAIALVLGAAALMITAPRSIAVGEGVLSAEARLFVVQHIEACMPDAARGFWTGATVPAFTTDVFVAIVELISRGSDPDEIDSYFKDIVRPTAMKWAEADQRLFEGLAYSGLFSQETRSCVVSNALDDPPT